MAWSTGYNPVIWGGIIVHENYLYVETSDTITQTDLSTGQIVNSSWVTGLQLGGGYFAIDNGYMYITSIGNNSSVYKIEIANPSNKSIFFNNSLNSPLGIDIYNGYLYIANSGADYISKVSLTNPSTDYNVYWFSDTTINQPVGLCIYGNDIYVTNTGGSYPGSIYKINITTKAISPVIETTSETYYDLVIYQNNIYTTSNNRVVQIDLNGNILNDTYALVSSSYGLVFNGNYLYVMDDADLSVYRFLISPSPIACFKEDSKILTNNGYIPIQDLRKGDLVKTLKHDYKAIDMIGKRTIYHPALKERIKDQLYKCSKDNFNEIFEPLIITGCHSILVENSKASIDEKQIEKVKEINGGIYLTDDKLRLPACVDLRTSVYETPGTYTIYHLALENNNYVMNYGIYANGLLVETCSQRYLKELSNMTLIE